jgi:hypothetical protein
MSTDLMMSTDMIPFFTPDRAYPYEDLLICVQTPRCAFSADGGARALSAEGLEGALSATAEQSEPRTPFDWSNQARTMQEEQVRFWVEDADLDQKEGTLPVDAEPSFCGEKRALSSEAEAAEEDYYYCQMDATPRPPPLPIADDDHAVVVDPAPEAAPVNVRVYFSGQRIWGGAAAPKRARRAAKAPKPLRVVLPMGEDATLAHGALVFGMAGAKAEERRRLIEVARELRGWAKGWADAIEETINRDLIPADAPLLSFGGGANDDLDLRRMGKGVARHAERTR